MGKRTGSAKVFVIVALVVLLALPLQGFKPGPVKSPRSGPEMVAYFTSWGVYGQGYVVKDIVTRGAAPALTVINYAFANVVPVDTGNGSQVRCQIGDAWADYQMTFTADQSVDGVATPSGQALRGHFDQLKKLKAMYPGLKVMIALGGWSWSGNFSDAALTPASRQAFVASCIDLFIKGNLPADQGAGGAGAAAGLFDGIDVDWEYPASQANAGNIYRPEDTKNFTALLAEFRKQLDQVDPNLMLTIAAPAGKLYYSKIEINKIHRYLDFINLMTYDFHGTFQTPLVTNHQSNLMLSPRDPSARADRVSVTNAVMAYMMYGVSPRKLVVGVPFYGHGWTGVKNKNNGLYQPATGAAVGPSNTPGSELYRNQMGLTNQGYKRYYDPMAMSAWLFDGSTFWTYDDPQIMCMKSSFVRGMGLRGIMMWELSGDDDSGSLITALQKGLDKPGRGNGWGRCW